MENKKITINWEEDTTIETKANLDTLLDWAVNGVNITTVNKHRILT